MTPTDNLKTLAKRYDTTPAAIRAIADDLGLNTTYAKDRRTWVLAEDASTVAAFNEHLAGN